MVVVALIPAMVVVALIPAMVVVALIAAGAVRAFVLERPNVERMPTAKGEHVVPMPTLSALRVPINPRGIVRSRADAGCKALISGTPHP